MSLKPERDNRPRWFRKAHVFCSLRRKLAPSNHLSRAECAKLHLNHQVVLEQGLFLEKPIQNGMMLLYRATPNENVQLAAV